MQDTYNDFSSLSSIEKEHVDFQIHIRNIDSGIAVIAPHGGCIEPGTSEIAKSIAGENLTCYCFEGIKAKENNKYLHITSTRFDEPKCIEICSNSETIVTIHGDSERGNIVFVGGLDHNLKSRVITNLKNDGFHAQEDTTNHSGQNENNICNKGSSKMGLQLEISFGLRKKMFKGLKRKDRNITTEVFDKFIASVKSGLGVNGIKHD